ncbi:Atrochrysone carboxylic acid synthase [Colletotrichum gloeosporioides]|uniref:Atrochrysone carboxylic acid synthase n=1 Tax=Colletotrichum gloeosporioides TaxID=474922 RepID=A0A8H4FK30_COLGL|nr:Atrochrysone carboxylic acid synthase [Colletotrichum gloeosporioides]KAF3803824.1 Atrochrysone carboxylic acid synthase [Colletotrichum gloeosporioides]
MSILLGFITSVPSMRREKGESWQTLSRNMAALHCAGVGIDFNDVHQPFEQSAKLRDLPLWSDKKHDQKRRRIRLKLLVPLKIVYLSEKSGLYVKEMERLIKAINLDEDFRLAIIHAGRIIHPLWSRYAHPTRQKAFASVVSACRRSCGIERREGLISATVFDRYLKIPDSRPYGAPVPKRQEDILRLSSHFESLRNLKCDLLKLSRMAREEDDNLTWFCEKADRSITRKGEVSFRYSIESPEEFR